ncbi:MAG: mechanosensitive ion channel, partial [Gammaproteobacteria bacterium]
LKITYGTVVALTGWFIAHILRFSETWFYYYTVNEKYTNIEGLKAQFTKIKMIRQLLTFIITIITISAILLIFNHARNVGISLLASTGLITAILGFAAQKPLSIIFTSFGLAFSQPIKIDDVVIIENEYGTIEEITMSYVVVRIWDARRIIVPANYFIDHIFQNWTYKKTNLIGTIFLYGHYSLPLQALRDELKKQLHLSTLWDKEVYNLQLTDFKEHCIELRILVSAATPGELWNLRVEIREKMLDFINRYYPECLPCQRIEIKPYEKKSHKAF